MPKPIDPRPARTAPTPPAAGYVPTLRGNAPLPTDRVTPASAVDWSLLTPREAATLRARGADPALPVPPAALQPARPAEVTIGDLPAEDLERFRADFGRPAASVAFVDDLPDVPDEVLDPALAAARAVAAGALQAAAAPAPPPPDSAAGAALPLEKCPHCSWPLDQPDDASPTDEDRAGYVEAILGERPFVRRYELFGGRAVVVFRTLTLSETDALYAQVSGEMDAGKLKTGRDFFERVQRLRLCLQLQRLTLPGRDHNLPDGLSPGTNPAAAVHWEAAGDRPLIEQIEERIRTRVVAQEGMFLAIGRACSEFNRLTAKLLAEADAADFSGPTAGGS